MLKSDMKKPKQLEDENMKLKKLVAALCLDNAMLQDVLFAGNILVFVPADARDKIER